MEDKLIFSLTLFFHLEQKGGSYYQLFVTYTFVIVNGLQERVLRNSSYRFGPFWDLFKKSADWPGVYFDP